MTDKELWAEFCSKKKININTPYEAWGFGGGEEDDTDRLAELVLQGKNLEQQAPMMSTLWRMLRMSFLNRAIIV